MGSPREMKMLRSFLAFLFLLNYCLARFFVRLRMQSFGKPTARYELMRAHEHTNLRPNTPFPFDQLDWHGPKNLTLEYPTNTLFIWHTHVCARCCTCFVQNNRYSKFSVVMWLLIVIG
jgi:hypothetical protein